MLWEQFIRPSLKAMRTLVIRRLQGCGNTASLSYPDAWVRKPGCLHLPYSHERQNLHPRLLHPAKLPFRMEGQIKYFPDKVKLKEFIITKPLLYEMLKGLI